MGSPMAPSHLTLSDLERSNSGADLGPMLLLNINGRPYMRSSSKSPRLQTLISRKERS